MTEQPDAEGVTSKRDAVLWMWKAHNQVQHAQHLVRAACHALVQICVPPAKLPSAQLLLGFVEAELTSRLLQI